MKRRLQMFVILLVLLAGQLALACPVCFSAQNDESRTAFISMTGFLTLLPLALVGGGVWWLWRRTKDHGRKLRVESRARRTRSGALTPTPSIH